MLGDGNVQGNTTKDFVEEVDRFMASLTESLSYSKGKTLLYVPPVTLICGGYQSKDKYMTQRLESIVIRWTRQVKEVCPRFPSFTFGQEWLTLCFSLIQINCMRCKGCARERQDDGYGDVWAS